MLRKKIAALLAAMMTITSLGTTAFGAVEDGQNLDELLGNALLNGTFENSVNVGTDENGNIVITKEWVPSTGISRVEDVTHSDSAGAAFVNQAPDSPVYCAFRMDGYRYYSAEAYVKLYDATATANAKIVLAVKNGDTFEPISTTAVETEVNGTGWTKLEGEFIHFLDNDTGKDYKTIYCYIELDQQNEQKFYLDDVVVKKTDYILPTTIDSVELVEDNDGNKYLMGTLTAVAAGEPSGMLSLEFLSQTYYDINARLMLDKDSETTTAEAYTAYRKYNSWGKGTEEGLPSGVHKEVSYNAKPNTSSSTTSKYIGVFVEGAAENDVIYFGGFSVVPTQSSEVGTAVIEKPVITAAAGIDAQVTVPNPQNTVAVRYFFMMADSADAADSDWTVVESGHTLSGTLEPQYSIKLEDEGKYLKVKVVPMNEACIFGDAKESDPVEIKAPFDTGVIDDPVVNDGTGEVTSEFSVTNNSGVSKDVTAVVAYYDQKGEMIAIGAETQEIGINEKKPFEILTAGAASYTTRRIFILNGGTNIESGVKELFPLSAAK